MSVDPKSLNGAVVKEVVSVIVGGNVVQLRLFLADGRRFDIGSALARGEYGGLCARLRLEAA